MNINARRNQQIAQKLLTATVPFDTLTQIFMAAKSGITNQMKIVYQGRSNAYKSKA